MTFKFKKAEPKDGPISIALAGPGGSGKTLTALILAKALADGGKIAFIDTESGRGLAYASEFDYLYTNFEPPFSPDRYIEAMKAAVDAGAKVVVVDSASHEWEGEGGLLEMVDAVKAKGPQYNAVAWSENKPKHRNFVYYAARGSVHAIFCFRAREKTEVENVVENGRKKTIFRPIGWQPITNEDANFDFTLFAMLDPSKQGTPMAHDRHKFIKYLEPHWQPGQQITPEIADKIAAWANGAQKPLQASPAADSSPGHSDTGNVATGSEGAAVRQQMGISHAQAGFIDEEDYNEKSRRLWTAIGKAHTSDKISDLVKQFMDLGGLVPDETLNKLRERLDAKALEIREAEKAA